MSDREEQEAKLEYLKVLLSKGQQSASTFQSSLRGFFFFAIIFFVFLCSSLQS